MRTVRVINPSELSLFVNNVLMGDRATLRANQLKIDVFGTKGNWELHGAYGQLRIGAFKSGSMLLEGNILNVDRQGYYTILVRDQELQQQLVQIYVIPSGVQGD